MTLHYQRYWQTIGWLALATVTAMTLIPSPPTVTIIHLSDKALHFLAYGALSFWFYQTFRIHPALIAAGLAGWGILLEFLQGMGTARQFEIADMIANGCGVLFGLLSALTPLKNIIPWCDRQLHRRLGASQ